MLIFYEVVVCVFLEKFFVCCIDELDVCIGFIFGQNQYVYCDGSVEKQVWCQGDYCFNEVVVDQIFVDFLFCFIMVKDIREVNNCGLFFG